MMNEKDLRNKRGELNAQMRSMLDAAQAEERDFTAEEREKYERIENDFDKFSDQLAILERAKEREKQIESREVESKPETRELSDEEMDAEYRDAYWRMVVGGDTEGFRRVLEKHETRNYKVDGDTLGGYLVPETTRNELIRGVDDIVVVRQNARVIPVNGRVKLKIPKRTARASGATWTGETTTVSEDTNLALGQVMLEPNTMTSEIRVSRDLLRSGAINVEQFIVDEMRYDFATAEEQAFMTGNGDSIHPLGVFTAADEGISTSRDVSGSNTTTAIAADTIFDVLYKLKPQYRRNARWIGHRDWVKRVRKLQDGEGQYLWQMGLQAGEPDRLAGIPVTESEFAPNTFTTGEYVAVLGDFSHYYIAQDMNFEIQRLTEKHALENEVGLLGRMAVDGMPALEEAFVRMSLA